MAEILQFSSAGIERKKSLQPHKWYWPFHSWEAVDFHTVNYFYHKDGVRQESVACTGYQCRDCGKKKVVFEADTSLGANGSLAKWPPTARWAIDFMKRK